MTQRFFHLLAAFALLLPASLQARESGYAKLSDQGGFEEAVARIGEIKIDRHE